MLILGIETSCDDTSLALVEASGGSASGRTIPRFRVLTNLISSQTKIHSPFGGVVPNLAKREHLKNLPILWRKILENFSSKGESASGGKVQSSNVKQNPKFKVQIPIDLIAVTVGPGLEPALWTGIVFAQSLTAELRRQYAEKRGKKPLLVGANHLEGHLYSFLLPKKTGIINNQLSIIKLFPAISLIVSGGHTILLLVKDLAHWKKLGETRDDAVGEAFDKVARLLELPYPGGPEIEKLALRQAQGKHPKGTIEFPRPMLNQKNYDFSFSGLKTSVLYFLKEQEIKRSKEKGERRKGEEAIFHTPYSLIPNVAASFQSAAIDVLVQKTLRAAREYGARSIMLSGGVAANKVLRTTLRREAKKIGCAFFAPEAEYITDNAAMIAVAGYLAHLRKKRHPLRANGMLGI